MSARLQKFDLTWGVPNWEIPPRKNISDSDTYTKLRPSNAKSLSHARQCMAVLGNLAHSQIFVWGPINFRFGYMTRTDPKGHP